MNDNGLAIPSVSSLDELLSYLREHVLANWDGYCGHLGFFVPDGVVTRYSVDDVSLVFFWEFYAFEMGQYPFSDGATCHLSHSGIECEWFLFRSDWPLNWQAIAESFVVAMGEFIRVESDRSYVELKQLIARGDVSLQKGG